MQPQAAEPSFIVKETGDIDVYRLFQVLWGRRLLILATMGITLLLAILYLHFATYSYTAEMDIAPAQNSSDGLGGKLGGLSGLASLAGIRLDAGQNASSFELYIEGLHSREVADQLALHLDVMKIVFRGDWDARLNKWRPPPVGVVGSVKKTFLRLLGQQQRAWQPPDGAQMQQYLISSVAIVQDPKKPVVKVNFSHPDPEFAKHFLDVLNLEVDRKLKAKALARSTEFVRFLSEKLQTVTVAEHRLALAQSLSEQEKMRIMASSTLPFAAEIFDGPAVSAYPTKPKAPIVLAAAFFIGLLVGTGIALVNAQLRRRN